MPDFSVIIDYSSILWNNIYVPYSMRYFWVFIIMVKVKLTRLLNHYTLAHFERLAQLDPEAIIEVNAGVAEQIIFEIENKVRE